MQSGHEPNEASSHGPVWNAASDMFLRTVPAVLPLTPRASPAGAFVFLLKEVHHV